MRSSRSTRSSAPRALLDVAQHLEAGEHRVRAERWGPRTLDVDVLLVGDEVVDEPDLVVPHPRMRERAFVLVPLADLDAEWAASIPPSRADVRPTRVELRCPSSPAPPTRGWNEEVMVLDHTQRAFALVGPGRAGTTLALAMAARGWTPIAVAGRDARVAVGAPRRGAARRAATRRRASPGPAPTSY